MIDRINAHSRGSAISAVFITVYRHNLSVAAKRLALEVTMEAGVRHMSLNSLHGLRACTAAMITHLTNTEKCQPRTLSHVISCVRGRIASPCRFRGLKTHSKRQRSCNQFGSTTAALSRLLLHLFLYLPLPRSAGYLCVRCAEPEQA